MKTIKYVIGLLMLLSGAAVFAGTPQRTLSFASWNGHILFMSVTEEEAIDSMPFEPAQVLAAYRSEQHRSLFEHQFDLSGLVQPEEEADDVIIDTAKLFRLFTKCSQAKK